MTANILTIHPTQLTYHDIGLQVNFHRGSEDHFVQISNGTLTSLKFNEDRYSISILGSNGNLITIPGTGEDEATVQILALTDEPDDQS